MTIEAKVIAHSSHPGCPDLFTLQLRYPRFIHSEFMTHRVFSRNASSSRAVPISRMIEEVERDPAMPVEWGRNQAGMQAGEAVDNRVAAEHAWLLAFDEAVVSAKRLERCGLHKQIVNRVLEPFSHISVVVTATDWDNFFDLRISVHADPTICALAVEMRNAMQASVAWNLGIGEWHTPYAIGENKKISVARCARVSYLNHDGVRPSRDEDLALYNRLLHLRHMSPFEHQATPTPGERHANFNGWQSLRSMVEEDN